MSALDEAVAAMALKAAENIREDLDMPVNTMEERKVRQRASMFALERGTAKPKQRIVLDHTLSGTVTHKHTLCPRSEELLSALTGGEAADGRA